MSTSLFYSVKSKEDRGDIVVSYICNFYNAESVKEIDCHLRTMITEKRYGEFVTTCCNKVNDNISNCQDKDVESIYFLLIEIVKDIGDDDKRKTVCVDICTTIISSTMSTMLKARILSLILNSMPSFKSCRVALLKKIIAFAHETKSLEFYYKFLMGQNVNEWEDVMVDYRQVLISLRGTLLEMKRTKEAHQCILKLISTFKPKEEGYADYAAECAIEHLQNTMIDDANMVEEQNLLADLASCDKDLYDLISIVNAGDLVSLNAFIVDRAYVLDTHNLSADVLVQHCRVLALTKLCGGRQTMSYEEIAKELMIDVADAEKFIVSAVQLNLVEGRMDQIKGLFTVSRTQYVVVDGEWKSMLDKISLWKENVNYVIECCDSYMG